MEETCLQSQRELWRLSKMNAMLETPELPAVFDGVKLAAVAAVLYVIVRCLNLKSPTAPPDLYFQDSGLSRFLLKSCPLLTKEPSSTITAFLFASRTFLPTSLCDSNFLVLLMRGTPAQVLKRPRFLCVLCNDVTMVICPGIANHSEKQYIRTFVDYAQKNGYRCAVLNHLGALPNIELTSPRMFTYACEIPACEIPVCEIPMCEIPVCEISMCEIPVCEIPVCEIPVCEIQVCAIPVCEIPVCEIPVCEIPVCEIPVCEIPGCEIPGCEIPVCEIPGCEIPGCEIPGCCTWEFGAMVNYIKKTYPQTQLVVVGFSLGGNIVCKYLGETQANQEKRIKAGTQHRHEPACAAVMAPLICCGSSRAQETFMQWDQCRRFYNFLMADNMKKIILSHRQALFGDHVKKPQSLEDTDLSRLYTATSLMQIDDNVMRKFHGYNSLKEYYEEESCMRYLHRIYVPLMLVNAADDPLVHESLLTIPKSLSEKRENVMFVLPLHGGHLGFFEGSVLFPEPLTWMDKLVVEYANAICQWERNKSQCSDTEQMEAEFE
ncbi:Abhydrolase domain-containing protein 2 [Microtus ochrogaster]|uniref:Monoacylglycerol lipase ABHD2 n=3 Tax=Euarchontoglires TaxID=314146 RepID=A0A8J6G8D8_MICOH|nr:Abhydrolase domain-containing protein 2 [Microtus ochrogaster]